MNPSCRATAPYFLPPYFTINNSSQIKSKSTSWLLKGRTVARPQGRIIHSRNCINFLTSCSRVPPSPFRFHSRGERERKKKVDRLPSLARECFGRGGNKTRGWCACVYMYDGNRQIGRIKLNLLAPSRWASLWSFLFSVLSSSPGSYRLWLWG